MFQGGWADAHAASQVVDVGVMTPWEKILDAAEEHKVQQLALFVHVA